MSNQIRLDVIVEITSVWRPKQCYSQQLARTICIESDKLFDVLPANFDWLIFLELNLALHQICGLYIADRGQLIIIGLYQLNKKFESCLFRIKSTNIFVELYKRYNSFYYCSGQFAA